MAHRKTLLVNHSLIPNPTIPYIYIYMHVIQAFKLAPQRTGHASTTTDLENLHDASTQTTKKLR